LAVVATAVVALVMATVVFCGGTDVALRLVVDVTVTADVVLVLDDAFVVGLANVVVLVATGAVLIMASVVVRLECGCVPVDVRVPRSERVPVPGCTTQCAVRVREAETV
jgi:hypothetical protein